jgi:hypothetical protein
VLEGGTFLVEIKLTGKQAKGNDATRRSLESGGGDILMADSTQTRLS